MISTHDLSQLPSIDTLKRLSQSLAMLDAIVSPEWEFRYYSFNARWNANHQMASMRNGEGDDYFLLFTPAGAIMKGFVRDAPRVSASELSVVPAVFADFLREPAFSIEDTTFCFWRTYDDTAWQNVTTQSDNTVDDGSAQLLSILDGEPQSYQEHAKEYFEQTVDIAAITHIYQHLPLTQIIVSELNSDIMLDDLTEDLAEIDYPR